MPASEFSSKFRRVMSSPLTIVLGVALGTLVGLYNEPLTKAVAPWGDLYLSALQMTIIPYIVVTISSSISKLLGDNEAKSYIKKIFVVFSMMLVLTSAVGLIGGLILQPGKISQEEMSNIMQESNFQPSRNVGINDPIEVNQTKGLIQFFTESLPSNIFSAFSEGQVLQIVFFTLIFGIALGYTPKDVREVMFPILETLRQTFIRMIRTIVLFLPIGVAFIFADQVANISADMFLALIRFLVTTIIVMFIMVFVASIVIWRNANTTYFKSLLAFSDTIFIALSTRNSLVTMPTAITDLIDNLKFDRRIVNLVVPIGIATCRYGNVLYFAFATVFISQIYNIPLSAPDYIIIIVGSIMAGITTSGASGIVTLPMMSIILDPLGLPLGAVLILFYAIDPIVDPFRTLSIVYTNCAATAAIADQGQEEHIPLAERKSKAKA